MTILTKEAMRAAVEALKGARDQLDEDCFTNEPKQAALDRIYAALSLLRSALEEGEEPPLSRPR